MGIIGDMDASQPQRPPSARVSQRDIAAAAGVSQVTVSLALRGHPSLPEETRERIRSLAARMGYVPDPALSALVSYRNTRRPAGYHSTLGWINSYPTPNGWKTSATTLYHRGAVQRAAELGYNVEIFWLREAGMSPTRMSDILKARGISGLILPPQPQAFDELSLDWSRFAVVALGLTLAKPNFHVVANHHFRSVSKLLRWLLELGYRRPGFAVQAHMDDRVGRAWSGAFLAEAARLPSRDQIPPHLPPPPERPGFDAGAFAVWFRRHRPDAIVTIHKEVFDVLREEGLRVPRDIGVAFPTVFESNARISGIDENSMRIGRSAVDILAGLLNRNELGVPEAPMRVLIQGDLHEGQTTRDQRVNASQ